MNDIELIDYLRDKAFMAQGTREQLFLDAASSIERLRKALAVFADDQSWMWHDHERKDDGHWGWDKMGDFADPREFARLTLENE